MRVLVVSPHPDDETLGAGGTLLRWKNEGHLLYWLNITGVDGSTVYSEEFQKNRTEQINRVSQFFGFKKTYLLNLAPASLESCDSGSVIEQISKIFKEIEPEVIILPDYNDVHTDHRCVYDWCFACTKCFRCPSVKKILTMEIVSETEFGSPRAPFIPNCYVDISDYLEEKIKAFKIYESEIGKPPFPRSEENIRALATVRGSTAGFRYAEAFKIVKEII